jgi:hypothetical protein
LVFAVLEEFVAAHAETVGLLFDLLEGYLKIADLG